MASNEWSWMWPEDYICFCGVTNEGMSSIFEMLFLFWLAVMYLLSSWDEIDVRVKWLVDDVWESEDDKTCFLSVGVDSFDRLFLKNDQFPCPRWKLVLKNENMINKDKREISKNWKMIFFDEWWKYIFWLDPLQKRSKIEKYQAINFDKCSYFFIDPFLLKEYILFSQSTESSLEQ